MPKLSVIVPIYNVETFLEECFTSIVLQTFNDFEVLAIDDGSTDGSGKICDIYAKKHPKIKCLHTKNSGYAATCNLGIKSAKGEFISIIEADDFIDAEMFENMLKTAIATDAEITKSRYYEFLDYKGKRTEKICGADIETSKTFSLNEHPELLRFHPSIWSCIYKADFLRKNEIIFCENKFRTWQDNLFQIKSLFFARRIAYVNKPYYHWRTTHLFNAEKIRNATMPILIIKETHEFLKAIGNKNIDIFANLQIREMVYFKSAVRIANFSDLKIISNSVGKYFDELEKINIKRSPYYKKKYTAAILRTNIFLYFILEKAKFSLSKIFKTTKTLLS